MIGVPPGELKPLDAIMHTDQLEDGTEMAEMACNFINKVYADAPRRALRLPSSATSPVTCSQTGAQGMRTIARNCAKANMVHFVDIST